MEIKIRTEYITLGQLLKYIGLINTGGQAKAFLAANSVLVNEAAGKRGKKVFPGDAIQVNGTVYRVSR